MRGLRPVQPFAWDCAQQLHGPMYPIQVPPPLYLPQCNAWVVPCWPVSLPPGTDFQTMNMACVALGQGMYQQAQRAGLTGQGAQHVSLSYPAASTRTWRRPYLVGTHV